MSDSNGNIRSQGRRKSNFPAKAAIPAGSTFDFVSGGVNYKITIEDLNTALGVTGSIVQSGGVGSTPVLDKQGSENRIRNIKGGSGIGVSLSPENEVLLKHAFTFNADGVSLTPDATADSPLIRSIKAGSGINVAVDGDTIQVTATGAAASTKTVLVNQLSDFPIAVAGVITLEAATEYRLTNDVDIGTNRIVMKDLTSISGAGSNITKLTYTGTGNMLTWTDARVSLRNLRMICANGTMFSATNPASTDSSFVMDECVVEQVKTIGTIARTVNGIRITNTSFLDIVTDGLTVQGANGYLLMEGVFMVQTAGIALDLDTSTWDGIVITNSALVTKAAGLTMLSGLANGGNLNSGKLGTLANVRVGGFGATMSGITIDDANWQFYLNDGLPDTRVDGLLSMQGNTTNTTIAAINTPVLVAGTWVVEDVSQMAGTTAGRLTLKTVKDTKLPIDVLLTLEPASGGSQDLCVYIAVNGTVKSNSKIVVSAASGTPANISTMWQEELSPDDYVEVFVANASGTTDILVSSALLRVN